MELFPEAMIVGWNTKVCRHTRPVKLSASFLFTLPASSLHMVSLQPVHTNTGILIRPFRLIEPDSFFFFWCILISFLEMLPLFSLS